MHGFPVPPGDAEALVAAGRRRVFRVQPRTVTFAAAAPAAIGGLLVTDRVGTALDCLAFLPRDDALDLYAWLSSRGVLDHRNLAAAARLPQRWGVRQLRELAELTRSGAVSAAEHRTHALLRSAGITGWEASAPLSGVLGRRAVADLLFRAERLVIEVDGERAHAGRAGFVADRRRQNDLVLAGYLVLRFTWWDLTERPDEVIHRIRLALLARAGPG